MENRNRNKIQGLQSLKGIAFILIFISHVFDIAFLGRGGEYPYS